LNVVYCAYRSWSLGILQALLRRQAGKAWKIKLVIAPHGMELGRLEGVETLSIDPQELRYQEGRIHSIGPAVILAYGWSWSIPKEVLRIAPCWILHPSPLPKYRGGSPIQNQLLNGVTESAITIFRAAEKLDAGNILAQESISFEGDLQAIFDRMQRIGLAMTERLMDLSVKCPLSGTPQDESTATVVKRRTPAMSEITLDEIQGQPARYLYDKIRGLQPPYPEAFIRCRDGEKLFITRTHLEET